MPPSEAVQIARRFAAEVAEIQQQVNFLKSKFIVHVSEVDELNQILTDNGLDALPAREYLGLPPHELKKEEVARLAEAFQNEIPKIEKVKCKLLELMDQIPNENESVDSSLFGEWVDLILEGDLSGEESAKEIEQLVETNFSRWMYSDEEPDPQLSDKSRKEILVEAFNYARLWRLNDRVNKLQRVIDREAEIRTIARASKRDATIGVHRQAFITMMAAFDAAIFDLVRSALAHRFFELVGVFEKENIKLRDIADAGSFHALRDWIIESQLKKRYVKELLNILNDEWGMAWLQEGNPTRLNRLIEVIQRRNLHLHARGVVDRQYVDGINILRLAVGDLAVIDESYWLKAKDLCTHCVKQVSVWANTDNNCDT